MITEHGLPIAAAVFLIGMVLYGHHRGFLRQCVSVGALVLTILLVKMAAPAATEFIRANPEIRDRAARTILNASGWQAPSAQEVQFPAAQRIAIENMKLPQSVKDILLENNNSEFYHILGVDQFAEYISTYLADMLGSKRETVSRQAKKLTELQLISMEKNHVSIPDMEKLREYFKQP